MHVWRVKKHPPVCVCGLLVSKLTLYIPHWHKISEDNTRLWIVWWYQVIMPKPRSKRWISTSIVEGQWDSELARTAGADYHANNMQSQVLFQEGLRHVPRNAIVIEIAPHGLLQAILKRSLGPDARFVSLMKKNHPDNVHFFLASLGRWASC